MITKRKYPIHSSTVIVSARVPKEIADKLNYLCLKTGRSKSDVIIQILDDYLGDIYNE